MSLLGGYFRTFKKLSAGELDNLRKKFEDAYTGPIPRGFGIGEIGPEIMWIDVTTVDSPNRRFVSAHGDVGPDGIAGPDGIGPNPNVPRSIRPKLGRCASCGSSEYRQRNGQAVCAYCRSAT